MQYSTYKYKTVTCPLWNVPVQIKAKYVFSNADNEAKLNLVTCPIRENLMLPENQRSKEYKAFAYCRVENCPKLKVFPKVLSD